MPEVRSHVGLLEHPYWTRWAPEGAHLDCSCMPVDLAGAGKASHANCAVVSRRTLAAAVAWWWQCMTEWKRAESRSGDMNGHRLCCIYLFIYCHVACC